jgi:UDP-galactopyranose mutase
MLASYHAMTASHPNVVFGGRLGSYKYIDMHQAIGAARQDVRARGRAVLCCRRRHGGRHAPRRHRRAPPRLVAFAGVI